MFMLFTNIWWSTNIWQINGGMPKRGLNMKKPLPVIRRKKTCQRYKHEYTELCYCLKPSTKGDTYVQTYFSCAHGGRFDCKRHIETKGHKDFDKLKANNKSMRLFCDNSVETCSNAEARQRNQTNAEFMLCTIIAQMNPYT